MAREAETKAVLGFVQNRIFAAARPKGEEGGLGSDVTLRKATESALPYVDKSFPREPLIEASVRMTLARSLFLVGDWPTAAKQQESRLPFFRSTWGPSTPTRWDAWTTEDTATFGSAGTLRRLSSWKRLSHCVGRARPGSPGHPAHHINMANSYGAIGREDEALKLRQATFALQKAKLGPAHRDTLVSMSNLALSYSLVGELTQALNLQEECVHLSKANLGTHHPTTLLNMLNLASIYKKAGRYAEALKLLEETLALQKEELGTDHPDLIMPMQFLSLIYGALGRYRDKLEVGERSLALCKAKLGRDHVLTIWTMQNLADSYYLLGRHAEALKLRQETLALRKAKVGPDDPDTLLTMASMALDLIAVHRDAEALGLIQEVIAKWGKLKTSDRGTLLSGAVYHAIAATARSGADQSTSSGQRASAEADSAIALLRQAVAAGYRDWGYIKGERAFDGLRDREDFKKVVSDLERPQEKAKP